LIGLPIKYKSFQLSVFGFQRKINLSVYFGIIFFNFFPLTLALSLQGEREYLSEIQSLSLPVEIQEIKYKKATIRSSGLEL